MLYKHFENMYLFPHQEKPKLLFYMPLCTCLLIVFCFNFLPRTLLLSGNN